TAVLVAEVVTVEHVDAGPRSGDSNDIDGLSASGCNDILLDVLLVLIKVSTASGSRESSASDNLELYEMDVKRVEVCSCSGDAEGPLFGRTAGNVAENAVVAVIEPASLDGETDASAVRRPLVSESMKMN